MKPKILWKLKDHNKIVLQLPTINFLFIARSHTLILVVLEIGRVCYSLQEPRK